MLQPIHLKVRSLILQAEEIQADHAEPLDDQEAITKKLAVCGMVKLPQSLAGSAMKTRRTTPTANRNQIGVDRVHF